MPPDPFIPIHRRIRCLRNVRIDLIALVRLGRPEQALHLRLRRRLFSACRFCPGWGSPFPAAALTCFCNFTGAGACGTTDVRVVGQRIYRAFAPRNRYCLHHIHADRSAAGFGAIRSCSWSRCQKPDATSSATTTPWVTSEPAKALPTGSVGLPHPPPDKSQAA